MMEATVTARRLHARDAKASPSRTCVVTRTEAPPDCLIRFVVDPSGLVVPDLRQKLPGRGVWVGNRQRLVAEAVRKRAFERGFKTSVKTSDQLPLLVDQLMETASLQALALAKKAGQVVTGQTKVDALISSRDAVAIIQACDASDGGRRRLTGKYKAICEDLEITPTIVEDFNASQLSLALGRENVVHAGAAQGSATTSFVRTLQRLQRYRSDAPLDPCVETTGQDQGLRTADTPRSQAERQD